MTSLAAVESHDGREDDLLEGYGGFVDALDIGPSPRWARRRAARQFVDQRPDLAAWMTLPTLTRLRDLHRCKAWPFLSWCLIEGHLRPDLELLLAKPSGVALNETWCTRHRGDVDAVTDAGKVLGWSENWTRQVTVLCLPLMCLWAGKTLADLDGDDFDGVLAELDQVAGVSASARYHARTRLFGLIRPGFVGGS